MTPASHLSPAAFHLAQAHAVSVLDGYARTLRCNACGREWKADRGGREDLAPTWWACPNGCNTPE